MVHFGERGVDWVAFRRWVEGTHRKYVAFDIVNYAKRYCRCLLEWDLSELHGLSDGVRPHVLKALSNLAKFLGVHEEYRRLIRDYGLSWSGRSNDDLIVDRLVKVKDPSEVFRWIKKVKQRIPELSDFLDLMAITGLRLTEAIQCYNLVVEKIREGRLGDYYNEEKGTLEHFRFKRVFIRKSKKVFISFVPKKFLEKITLQRIPSRFALQKRLQRNGLKGRFSDIRELHGTYMTKYLRESEINFIHGRVTASVFMKHYFNPVLIHDLKERVFKGIAEIQNKIS